MSLTNEERNHPRCGFYQDDRAVNQRKEIIYNVEHQKR